MNKFILSKIFYLLVYIFAVWESDTESHLLILLLEDPQEDRSKGKLRYNWNYALGTL